MIMPNYNKLWPQHKVAISLSVSCVALIISLSYASFFLAPLYRGPRQLLLHNPPPHTRQSNSSFLHQTLVNRTQSCCCCDLSKGMWIPEESDFTLLYTNETCPYMQFNQNCLSNARPDRDYLRWRWKPLDCDLQRFDPVSFLGLFRGKKMAFIGDSLARNQMQALLCALTKVEDPYSSSVVPEGNLWNEHEYQWDFTSHNFTLGNIWSTFLVNHTTDEQGRFHLRLDMPDVAWLSRIDHYDIIVFSTAYWYFRPSIYYANNSIVGASGSSGVNFTDFGMLPAMRMTWETVLKHVVYQYKGISFLRTVTVPHFGEQAWNKGGKCNNTQPDADPHMNASLPWMTNEMHKIQIKEFNKAIALLLEKEGEEGEKDASRLKLIDITYSAFLRPDGHPGIYRNRDSNDAVSDCLHWCMPGPIDTWNEILLHTLKTCCNSSAELCG